MKIYINPGHSVDGVDHGACSFGLREADIALNIGKRVEMYLQAAGYFVKLFQYDGLQAICDDANAFKADLFVSIHCNAANGSAQGTETYASGGAKSTRLAELILKQITNSLPVVNRGVKTAGFYVLKHTEAPAVLVETAFIDNANDAKLLSTRQDDFARAIARGISDFFTAQIPTKPLPDAIDLPKSTSKLSKHFGIEEFTCHCCGKGADKINDRLITLLEQLRDKVNAPIHVNCGYRCPKHNAEVGGVPNSTHTLGVAADIYVPNISYERVKELVIGFPFDGIGLYPPLEPNGLWVIHVDTRSGGIADRYFWEG